MSITREELAQFRSESGLTQRQFAKLLNDMLDYHYTSNTIGAWESGKKPIPHYVSDAVLTLMGKDQVEGGSVDNSPDGNGAKAGEEDSRLVDDNLQTSLGDRRPDSPPLRPNDAAIISGDIVPRAGQGLEAMTIEMFRGMGGMIEFFGVMTGAPKVVTTNDGSKISLIELDGRTISADAETLGRAWAHLAAQNAWVNRILSSMTTGGAWVEAVAATSGTVMKVYRNHANYAEWLEQQSAEQSPVLSDTERETVV